MQSRGTPSEGGRPRAAGFTKRHTALDLDGDDWYIRHRVTEHRWYACRGGEGVSIGVGVCLGISMTYDRQYLLYVAAARELRWGRRSNCVGGFFRMLEMGMWDGIGVMKHSFTYLTLP